GDGPYGQVHFFDSAEEMLGDDSIVAISSEGLNSESLDQTEQIVQAGKHVWYDKPAGDKWEQWQRVVAEARAKKLQVQMGFMFRYHPGFVQIADWARSGFLGNVYSLRAHMSTKLAPEARHVIADGHYGGIFFDLAGHMLDQVVWILGRPEKTTTFLRNDTGFVPDFHDNTLGVFEYEQAMAWIDIAAMEPQPMARRFEVYGDKGSAILNEPFEPGHAIRLCLTEAAGGYEKGEQTVSFEGIGRQGLYDLELEAFVRVLKGEQEPDRSLDHELLVQETLLRGTGLIEG
ncbi:MAG: Gfo/Idh/MocA family oxidoreductase, partial [Candidatus Latescibacterota bacterium]|nr:Gfo/Idh/MocA family oxidoreductase [Candidatus Latescibacterota bacterium]